MFDSGIGGLTVLNEALRQAPAHHYIYLADSVNAPYGEKSSEWVAQRSLDLCHWLAREGCQAQEVGCNHRQGVRSTQEEERRPGCCRQTQRGDGGRTCQ